MGGKAKLRWPKPALRVPVRSGGGRLSSCVPGLPTTLADIITPDKVLNAMLAADAIGQARRGSGTNRLSHLPPTCAAPGRWQSLRRMWVWRHCSRARPRALGLSPGAGPDSDLGRPLTLFQYLCSWSNLLRAWHDAARGKRGHGPVAAFEYRLEENLLALQEELRTRSYVDDFVLFANDKCALWEWKAALVARLAHLRLTIHPGAHPRPVAAGLPFLGFTIYPHRRRLKRRKGIHFQRKLRRLLAQCEAGEIPISSVTASVRSWASHAAHGNTVGLRKAILGGIRLRPRTAKLH